MTDAAIPTGEAPAAAATASAEGAASADPEPPERHSAPLAVTIVAEHGDWSAYPSIEQAIAGVAAALASHPSLRDLSDSEASVVLGSDAMVRRLNGTYRRKDAPTNVLSFPYQPPPGSAGSEGPRYLGDVVLAAETIAREAAERDVAPLDHVRHLVVHGLLHLLGHDHHEEAEAQRMERLETEVLAILGVADPYAA
jgi:probable rRNA maturation factor